MKQRWWGASGYGWCMLPPEAMLTSRPEWQLRAMSEWVALPPTIRICGNVHVQLSLKAIGCPWSGPPPEAIQIWLVYAGVDVYDPCWPWWPGHQRTDPAIHLLQQKSSPLPRRTGPSGVGVERWLRENYPPTPTTTRELVCTWENWLSHGRISPDPCLRRVFPVEAQTDQPSYDPGPHPGLWVGLHYHLLHLWPARACEGTGHAEP